MGKSLESARLTLETNLAGPLEITLHTAEPGFSDGMSAFEVAYPGYERRAARVFRIVEREDSVAAVLDERIQFPTRLTTGETIATHWSIGQGGKRRYTGALDAPVAIRQNCRAEFDAGSVEIHES